MTEKSSKKKSIIKIVAICLTSIMILTGGILAYVYAKVDDTLNQITVPTKEAEKTDIETGEPIIQQVVDKQKPFTVLLAGLDNRVESGSINTDVLMFASYDPESKRATILSLPRDLKINSEEIGTHKVNYFFPYFYSRDKTTALAETKQFFNELVGLPIDYMITINFTGLKEIVDSLGGLDINVDMDMRYVDNFDGTNINLKAGQQLLDGKEVLDFVRYRKSNRGTEESSDFARNERQQQVVNQLLNKLGTLNGISQWDSILEIIGNNIKTDIEKQTLRDWIINFNDVKPASTDLIKIESTWKSPYVYAKRDSLVAAVSQIREQIGMEQLISDELLLEHFGTVDIPTTE
ncbi:MAG: LCP family protein [Candidatus Pristimantibacillus sp.]